MLLYILNIVTHWILNKIYNIIIARSKIHKVTDRTFIECAVFIFKHLFQRYRITKSYYAFDRLFKHILEFRIIFS